MPNNEIITVDPETCVVTSEPGETSEVSRSGLIETTTASFQAAYAYVHMRRTTEEFGVMPRLPLLLDDITGEVNIEPPPELTAPLFPSSDSPVRMDSPVTESSQVEPEVVEPEVVERYIYTPHFDSQLLIIDRPTADYHSTGYPIIDINPKQRTEPHNRHPVWAVPEAIVYRPVAKGGYSINTQLHKTHAAISAQDFEATGYSLADMRSIARFKVGVWEPLPKPLMWLYGIIPVNLYLHISLSDPSRVAYCKLNGGYDTEIVTTLGKFLRKFSEVKMTDRELQEISEDFATLQRGSEEEHSEACKTLEDKVHKGTSQAEFKAAYCTGIDSCMQGHKLAGNVSNYHPAEVYASGDFAIFTMKDDDGTVQARAVACTKNMAFWTVYPKNGEGNPCNEQGHQLKQYLLHAGFSRTTEWARGATLLALETSNGHGSFYSMPYIDQTNQIFKVSHSSYGNPLRFIIEGYDTANIQEGEHAMTYCDGSDGYIDEEEEYNFLRTPEGDAPPKSSGEDDSHWCEFCESRVDEDNLNMTPDNTYLCDSCYSEQYVYSENSQGDILRDEAVYVDSENDWYHQDDATRITNPNDSCYEEYLPSETTCEDRFGDTISETEAVIGLDEETYHNSEVISMFDGEYIHNQDEELTEEITFGREAGERFSTEWQTAVRYRKNLPTKSNTLRRWRIVGYVQFSWGGFDDEGYTTADEVDVNLVETYSTMNGLLGEFTLLDEGQGLLELEECLS